MEVDSLNDGASVTPAEFSVDAAILKMVREHQRMTFSRITAILLEREEFRDWDYESLLQQVANIGWRFDANDR